MCESMSCYGCKHYWPYLTNASMRIYCWNRDRHFEKENPDREGKEDDLMKVACCMCGKSLEVEVHDGTRWICEECIAKEEMF